MTYAFPSAAAVVVLEGISEAEMAASSFARDRLINERKQWRRNHPPGMFARPEKKEDGSTDLFNWVAGIPGKKGTPWEGATYRLRLKFPSEFPEKPPHCQFDPVLPHPNVYPSGTVCLSVLAEDKGWLPTLALPQVLKAVQDLLDEPNLDDPAQSGPYELARDDPAAYEESVRRFAAKIGAQDD